MRQQTQGAVKPLVPPRRLCPVTSQAKRSVVSGGPEQSHDPLCATGMSGACADISGEGVWGAGRLQNQAMWLETRHSVHGGGRRVGAKAMGFDEQWVETHMPDSLLSAKEESVAPSQGPGRWGWEEKSI